MRAPSFVTGCRPTRAGGFMLAGSGVTLLIAINYGHNLVYLLAFWWLAMWLNHYWLTRRQVRLLQGLELRCEAVFAGEAGLLQVRVGHSTRAGIGGLALRLAGEADEDLPAANAINLGPETSGELTLRLPPQRRGVWPLPAGIVLESRFPFGWFVARRPLLELFPARALPQRLVWPRPEGEAPLPEPPGGHRSSRSAAGGEDWQRLRPHQTGDRMSQLHWREFAKREVLATRVYEQPEGGGQGTRWLRAQDCPEPDHERCLSQLAQWILAAEQQASLDPAQLWGLEIGPLRLGPGHGPNQKRQGLDLLARQPGSVAAGARHPETALEKAPETTPGTGSSRGPGTAPEVVSRGRQPGAST